MELYDEDNTIVFLSVDLARVCKFFYSKLYACPSWKKKKMEYEEELLS